MITGRAPARTALVGNPSDGYGGAVVTLAIANWEAIVELRPLGPAGPDRIDGPPGLVAIAEATRRVLRRLTGALGPAHLSLSTTIPREVGLAGSSAVVVAVLDASMQQAGRELDGTRSPSLALRVETDELGIPGGLQDRVAQVWGGLMLCDVRSSSVRVVDDLEAGTYRRLPVSSLPPLAIAWLPSGAESSAISQAGLRSNADRAERFARLGALAVDTARSIEQGNVERLGPAMVETMAIRRDLVALHPAHAELVERIASTGAAANYSGSGGAVVATLPGEGLDELRVAVDAVGAKVEVIRVADARPGVS